MPFNANRLVTNYGATVVALTGISAATVTGPVFSFGSMDPESDTIIVEVSAAIKTANLTAATKLLVSSDGSTYVPLYTDTGTLCSAAVAAAGTGSLVTTAYRQKTWYTPPYRYLRVDVVVAGSGSPTGGASDNVTIGISFRKRAAI